ncbi:hypothetical protein [Plantactinospora sp. KBS50]
MVGTAYAFGIQLYAVRRGSPTRVAIFMSTEPVFARPIAATSPRRTSAGR